VTNKLKAAGRAAASNPTPARALVTRNATVKGRRERLLSIASQSLTVTRQSGMAISGMAIVDPFKIAHLNGREGRESGLRLNA